uniref:Uncharacterized protein n=1 Tax=Denticeps clupeoides TaxID=299321 RepID=A0AAY4C1L1_9TELE
MSTLILDNGAYLAKMCYSHAMLSCCKHKGTVLLHTVHLLCILRSFYFLVDFADTSIVITEPYFNFTSTQESMSEILLEEYHAHRYFCENSSDLCCIVVGRSFSFTHIVPYCRGGKMKDGICMSEVRAHTPTEFQVSLTSCPSTPSVLSATHGKEDYEENGHYICEEKTADIGHTNALTDS